jgi:signal transduction histidine kinase
MRRTGEQRNIQPIRDRVSRATRPHREIDRFQSLVSELSAAMTRASAHEVDREIEVWLGRISQALGLDRSGIYERNSPSDPVRTTHTWKRPDVPPLPRDFDPQKFLKTTTDWVLAGNQLVFSSPAGIPAELADAREFVARYGLKASAVIPMWAGNRVIGGAGFDKFRTAREWPPELLEYLAFSVRLFGSAIERKQSEIALLAAQAELRIASRRNMMSELVASLVHEINQPLGAILSNLGGLTRLLSQKNPERALALAAVSDAIEDTKRTSEIIRRVRFLFKGHAERKIAIRIGDLVSEVVKLVANEAALRKILVRVEIAPSVRRVIGDRVQLQQCLLNLIINAFDAIREAKSDRREVVVAVVPEKTGWVRTSVCDSGAGIARSVASRLFEPFVTTKSEGMGLGLLLTRSIVEHHGGRIWATPNPDQGATFAFTLPLAQEKQSGASKRAR